MFISSAASRYKHGQYIPMGLRTLLSVGLTVFCAALNLTRGLAVINDAHIEVSVNQLDKNSLTKVEHHQQKVMCKAGKSSLDIHVLKAAAGQTN